MKLILRNLQLYFRDMPAVIMSFLAEVIIMILYIMFIRDNLLSSFENITNNTALMDAWMISGILGITPVTASMGAYGVMIEDKTRHIISDFRISPMSPCSIITGYVMSAAIIGMVLSLVVLFIGEGYMALTYGEIAGAGNTFRILELIILNSLCVSAIVILPISFIKGTNALSGSCTIIGALIGFLTGIYLPMGTMGDTAQNVVINFPISHGVVLFRQALTDKVINNSPELHGDEADRFIEYMGIAFMKDGTIMSSISSIFILVTTASLYLITTFIIKVWMRKSL